MDLKAILHTIEWWPARHSTSPFSSGVIPKQDLWGSPLLNRLNHSKHHWSPLSTLLTPLPERAPNLMASFGSARVERIEPFISILQVLWAGRDKRPSRWSASLPACWIEGPLSALFMSTPLQKHIQITSQFSQWFLWYGHDGREGASLLFFYIPVDWVLPSLPSHPQPLSHLLFFFHRHQLHKKTSLKSLT